VRDEGVAASTPPVGTSLIGSSSAWFVLLGILCGYFALLLALGGHAEWDRLGVPADSGGFFDLRSVTSGWDCARHHWGEWPVNPCDPGGRPENYPRVWMAASILGLGQDDTYVIGFLIAVTFFVAAILVLPRRAPVGDAVIYGLALCSPAVMFGVERGNVDIALFSMVAAAGLVMRRSPYGPPAASALILLAAVLKLFPIAAVGMLARLPRRAAIICVSVVLGTFAVYAAATFRDIQTIERVLPQGDEYAFGLHISGGWLGRLVGAGRVWDAVLVALAIIGAIALHRRLRSQLSAGSSRELDLFWAGAGIYVATFALGRTSDYRLVFLLLTIPQLARWASSRQALPIATLVGVLLALWLPSPWSNVPVLNDLIRRWDDMTFAGGSPLPIAAPAQVIAFIGLTCLLAATLPLTGERRSTVSGAEPRLV
jgi:Glycosyltransferase family 87